MSLISAECFILQWLGHCQGDLIYSTWHFRWHLFHLDVILHDINSDLAARINIAVLFWETSREQTSWTLLHNLHYPAAQRIKRKKMLQFSSDLHRWGCHMCVMYCEECFAVCYLNSYCHTVVWATISVIIPRYILSVPGAALRLSVCMVVDVYKKSDCKQ